VAGAGAAAALVVTATLLVALPAAADRDPRDAGGRLDIRSVTGSKEGLAAPLVVTVRTWERWGMRLLRAEGPNRLVVMFDVDGDGRSDASARVVRSGGALVATIANDDGTTTALPTTRPSRSSVTFTVPGGVEANPLGDVAIAARTRSNVGAACDPVCRDRSPDAGFDPIGPVESPSPTGSPTPTTSPSPPGASFTCTEVVGFSQTAQWALEVPDFQDAVGDAAWQVRWAPGGAIYFWADPQYEGWDGDAQSPCADGADAPDRLVLTITSQEYEDDVADFVGWIEDAVDAARARYPSLEQVVLQAVVGGPGNGSCSQGGTEVRAAHNHPLVDAAIAQVVGSGVVTGPSPEVRTCDDYDDTTGHLVDAARAPIARAIADAYV
jgi:hypothetical protein